MVFAGVIGCWRSCARLLLSLRDGFALQRISPQNVVSHVKRRAKIFAPLEGLARRPAKLLLRNRSGNRSEAFPPCKHNSRPIHLKTPNPNF
jgi:hypothetical protein